MDYWRTQLPQNILNVNYEDLIQNPDQTLKGVMEYLELDPNYKFNTEQLHSQEIDHWRHYDKYLAPLRKALEEEIQIVEDKDEKITEIADLMGTAYVSFEQGDTLTAELKCQTLLEKESNHYSALHLLGIIYAQRAQYEKAIEYMEKALKIAPNVVRLH